MTKDRFNIFGMVQGLSDIHMFSYERVFWSLVSNGLKAFQPSKIWYDLHVVLYYLNCKEVRKGIHIIIDIVKTMDSMLSSS